MSGEPIVFKPEMNIGQALELDPKVEEVFRSMGLKCAGKKAGMEWCVATEKETLAEASLYHEVDLEKILGALNDLKLIPKA